ncbi:MAG: TetR/AcrR family transcriptional regulator [Desulfobacterales bacterium]|nr:TetR/AcrR family transcriptional regulator [Desulfobacterales bacterium]
MPRKVQFTAEEIVDAAWELVREKGWEGLSVTAVAKKIGSSTMPVYSYFENLDSLKDAVTKKGWEILMAYEKKNYTGDVWVDQSMGYIRFAMEHTHLFYAMFDGRNVELQSKMLWKHWQSLVESLEDYQDLKDLEAEQRFLIRYSRAMMTHGVATAVLDKRGKFLQAEGMIENLITAASKAILEGFKKTYTLEDSNIAFLDKEINSFFEQVKKLQQENK